jgi:hypothetical protein
MSYVYTLHMSKTYAGALCADIWIRPQRSARNYEPLLLTPVHGQSFPCGSDIDHARNVLKTGGRSVRIRYYDHNAAAEAIRALASAVAQSDDDDPLPISGPIADGNNFCHAS